MEEIVNLLIKNKKTIATMESCTGGFIASSITDIPGASDVLRFSAVTYSNEYKIKMGVSKNTIDKYSVYSKYVAREMAKSISDFALSDYGIGVTGKINRIDKNNTYGEDNKIFYCIYDNENNKYYDFEIYAIDDNRFNNKVMIKNEISKSLLNILSANE